MRCSVAPSTLESNLRGDATFGEAHTLGNRYIDTYRLSTP
jgi:hypothetical protein